MSQQPLFDTAARPTEIPLAEKARPEALDAIVGQQKILGPQSPLRRMIEEDDYSSFILWGPPGCGKTTMARCIEKRSTNDFYPFSAVLSKIRDVKELMEKAARNHRLRNKSTIVFVDEIHRFNKSQQDAFLPYIEAGAVILIGATTENPSFEIINALLSRCHVFVLEPLADIDIEKILNQALELLPKRLSFDQKAIDSLVRMAGGDARKALNDLELICRNSDIGDRITTDLLDTLLSKQTLFYDKKGEEHFNVISAFQKSIRGSDPQAALYWLARMLEAGEDPMYITRRLVRVASEDVGLADPQALVQAIATRDAVHFLGMPEANTALCGLTIYLATAPKSNSLELAYDRAREDAGRTSHLKVPLSVRNAPTKLMKELGYNKDYKYSHNYEHNYHYQRYLPELLPETDYYRPSRFGFEKEIKKRMDWWETLKKKFLQSKNNNKGNR